MQFDIYIDIHTVGKHAPFLYTLLVRWNFLCCIKYRSSTSCTVLTTREKSKVWGARRDPLLLDTINPGTTESIFTAHKLLKAEIKIQEQINFWQQTIQGHLQAGWQSRNSCRPVCKPGRILCKPVFKLARLQLINEYVKPTDNTRNVLNWFTIKLDRNQSSGCWKPTYSTI